MTKPELIALCMGYKAGDREKFQKIIAEFANLNSDNITNMMRSFGFESSTVEKYITGIEFPFKSTQRQIIDFIRWRVEHIL